MWVSGHILEGPETLFQTSQITSSTTVNSANILVGNT